MLSRQDRASPGYRRDIGHGLIVRWAQPDDAIHIVQLCTQAFRSQTVGQHVWRLLCGASPLMHPADCAVVQDQRAQDCTIVACACLFEQQWEYEGMPLRVGRPEFVATHPAYRHRGLVRTLFELLHARSEAKEHLVQALAGIPNFYRQFGYEYALDLGGARLLPLSCIPELKEGEQEAYGLRKASVDDVAHIRECYNSRQADNMVWTSISEELFRAELEVWDKFPEQERTSDYQIVVDAQGIAKGVVKCSPKRWRKSFDVEMLEVLPGTHRHAMHPSLLQMLQTYGQHLPTFRTHVEPFGEIRFQLGRRHWLYEALADLGDLREQIPSAWYVRVPNIAALLTHLAPVLEKRVAQSVASNYTGDLMVNLYQKTLLLSFSQGHLTACENISSTQETIHADAGCPPLLFLQLLFGYRSLELLQQLFYPDVWTTKTGVLLLRALFPVRPSDVFQL